MFEKVRYLYRKVVPAEGPLTHLKVPSARADQVLAPPGVQQWNSYQWQPCKRIYLSSKGLDFYRKQARRNIPRHNVYIKNKFITVSTIRKGRGLNITFENKVHTAQKGIGVCEDGVLNTSQLCRYPDLYDTITHIVSIKLM